MLKKFFHSIGLNKKGKLTVELKKIDLSKLDNITVDDIFYWDTPDFVDAYISSADLDGVPLTEQELDLLNEDQEFIYEQVLKTLY